MATLPVTASAERVCQSPDCLLVDNTHSAKGAVPSIGILDTRLHVYIYVPRATGEFVLGVYDQADDTPAGKPSAFVLYAPDGREAMALDKPQGRAWSNYPVATKGRWGVWRLSVTGPEEVSGVEGKPQEKARNRFLVRSVGAVDLYLKPEPVARVRGLRFDKPHFGGAATHRFTVQAPGVPRLRFHLLRPRAMAVGQVHLQPPAGVTAGTHWDTLQRDDRLAADLAFSTLEVAGADQPGQWPLTVAEAPGVYGLGVEQELRLFFTDTPLMPMPERVPITTTAGESAPARLEVTSPQTANERYVTFTDGQGRGALFLLPGVAYQVEASRGFEFAPQRATVTAGGKLRIRLTRRLHRKPGWYCGDNHAHTAYYDGTDTPAQVAEAARAEGLDWVALTEHGHSAAIERVRKANAEAAPLSEPGRFIVLPGEEFTTPSYHANILGGTVEAPAAAPLPQVIEAAEKKNSAAHPVTVALNHPSLGKTAADIARGLTRLPLIELWNSAEPEATQLWWELLNKGMRTFAQTSTEASSST
jgi:hypothetical protein